MKDKLRELAERWIAESTHGDWRRSATYADELLAILDAEGDGVAVATVGQPPEREELVSASLAISGWLALALGDPAVCAEMKRDINRWFDAAMPSATAHPVRSVVVSDEDVSVVAKMIADRVGNGMREKYEELAKHMVEHFAKGERHER